MAKNLMLMGTSSNVGKSVLCAALCRIFAQDGYRVAPFKSQNMSLNSAVTPSGREIGRAQAVQAEACGIPANEHMNPVLLKPTRHNESQIVLQGKVYKTTSARDYFHERIDAIWDGVVDSFQFLAKRYDLIVIEGAGSPVEMNLKDREIANMRTAEMADADVILVSDIDRGGIFASIVGTLQLLNESERSRVKGIIVNKFRGDPALFENGVRLLEEYAGVPVLGVIPHIPNLGIEEEDSVALTDLPRRQPYCAGETPADTLRIAIIQLPHISNFTDFDPLFLEASVHAYFCRTANDIGDAHAIVLSGTKNTMDDLAWLFETGIADEIVRRKSDGSAIFGVCGGYQMLGNSVRDPLGQESATPVREGFGWLPVTTTLLQEKTTLLVHGQTQSPFCPGIDVSGYEIHMGDSRPDVGYMPFAVIRDEIETEIAGAPRLDGAVADGGLVMGTYLHGIFDNDTFRRGWLSFVRSRFDLEQPDVPDWSMTQMRSDAYDHLANVVRQHLDMTQIYHMIGAIAKTTPEELGDASC